MGRWPGHHHEGALLPAPGAIGVWGCLGGLVVLCRGPRARAWRGAVNVPLRERFQVNAQVLLRSDMPFGCVDATGFIDAPYGGPRAHETARKQPDPPRSNTAARWRSRASGGPPPAARARSARQRHRGKTRR